MKTERILKSKWEPKLIKILHKTVTAHEAVNCSVSLGFCSSVTLIQQHLFFGLFSSPFISGFVLHSGL